MWEVTRPSPQARVRPSRFEIVPPSAQSLALQGADRDIVISPDGQYIVYRASAGLAQLVVRAIDRLDAHAIAGITNARQPFFSPDSEWIGFFDGAGLKKAPITGGSAITIWKNLCRAARRELGRRQQHRVRQHRHVQRTPARAGERRRANGVDEARRGEGRNEPLVPLAAAGGRGVLFTIRALNPAEPAQVAVFDLKTGQQQDTHSRREPSRVRPDRASVVCGGRRAARRAVRSGATRGGERSHAGRRRCVDGMSQPRPTTRSRRRARSSTSRRPALSSRGRSCGSIARGRRRRSRRPARLTTTRDCRQTVRASRSPSGSGTRRLDLGSRAGDSHPADLRSRRR